MDSELMSNLIGTMQSINSSKKADSTEPTK